jgi:DNA-binding NtrC family response regulator
MLETGSESLETYLPAATNPFAQERTERILIVDDEHFIRDVLTKVVSGGGFMTDTAQDAQEAIQKLAESEYEMVLTDITMPGLDGLQLLQHVATQYPEIAVIMITGVTDLKSAILALSSGAYDYVTKPFNMLELKNKIHKALERRRLVFENRQYRRKTSGWKSASIRRLATRFSKELTFSKKPLECFCSTRKDLMAQDTHSVWQEKKSC